ncbi:MAG: hypothetical protein ABMB14_34770 [Myxococcota bacterium]
MSVQSGLQQVQLFRERRTRNELGLDQALTLGGAVLDQHFGGDLEAWRAGAGQTTLRSLARDPAIGVSASTLYRYVAIAVLCRRMGRSSFAHVGATHLRQVLPLPFDQQSELVRRADAERWSAKRLGRAVAELHGTRKNGKHATEATYEEGLGLLQQWLDQPGRVAGLDGIARGSRPAAARTLELVRRVRRDLERLEGELRDRVARRDELP